MANILIRAFLKSRIAFSVWTLAFVGLWCIGLSHQGYSQSRFDQGSTRDRTMTPLFGSNSPASSWQSGQWLNSTMIQPTDWRLGIRVNNTETGVLVAFGDGSVRYIKKDLSADNWRGIITKAGGEVINFD